MALSKRFMHSSVSLAEFCEHFRFLCEGRSVTVKSLDTEYRKTSAENAREVRTSNVLRLVVGALSIHGLQYRAKVQGGTEYGFTNGNSTVER